MAIRSHIDIHYQFAALAMDINLAGTINRSIEGIITKITHVVYQHPVGFDIEVVGQSGQMFVMDKATQCPLVTLAVANSNPLKFYLVRYQVDGIVHQFVFTTQLPNHHFTIHHQLSYEIDFTQRAQQTDRPFCMSAYIFRKATCERLHKLKFRSFGFYR